MDGTRFIGVDARPAGWLPDEDARSRAGDNRSCPDKPFPCSAGTDINFTGANGRFTRTGCKSAGADGNPAGSYRKT